MLKTYSIFVEPNDLKRLLKDSLANQTVPASLEYNQTAYSGELSIRGHQMRRHLKKSFDFKLESDSMGIQLMHLNAEYKDPSMSRNKLSMDFFQKIGVLAPCTEHVLIYMNDEFKGLYLQLESFDEYFLNKRKLPLGPVYYATNDDANFSLITPENELKKALEDGYTRKLGEEKSLDKLRSLIFFINTTSEVDFKTQISKHIDIENYLLWLAGVVCTQNFDGFIHNYALYLNPLTDTFQLSPWDYDGTWGRNIKGRPIDYDYVPITGYNTLTARLLAFSSFRKHFKAILENVLSNFFEVGHLEQEVIQLHEKIKPYVLEDPFFQYNEIFDKEPDFILNFIRNRHKYLKKNLEILK